MFASRKRQKGSGIPDSIQAPRDPRRIVIYHVGGEDGYGPITAILEKMSRHVHLVVFEARVETTDAHDLEHRVRDGMPLSIVRMGIDDRQGTADFHINKWPLSSSLLPMSAPAANEDPNYDHCFVWGENVELDRTVRINTTTIDELVEAGAIPPPNVLSIDAQGAEVRILRGAAKTLADHVLCVVSEVEFFEIYQGQGLFDDQMQILGKEGFRLFALFNQQTWHPGPRAGQGFLTVGEAAFFKNVKDIAGNGRGYVGADSITDERLVRLAAIAVSFGAHSYVAVLMSIVRRRSPQLYESLRSDSQYGQLLDLAEIVHDNMTSYRKDKEFFKQNIESFDGRAALRAPPKPKGFLPSIRGLFGRSSTG